MFRGVMFINANLVIGVFLVGVVVALALVSVVYTPYPPSMIVAESASAPISAMHLLGGDYLGRDTFSRLMAGALITLTIAGLAISIASVVAFVLSMTSVASINSGTRRGVILSKVITFATNAFMGVPSLLIALAVVSALGGGTSNTVVAIAIMLVPPLTRIMKGAILEVHSEDYVRVARTWGVAPATLAIKHVLPNAAPTIVVALPIYMSAGILVEAGLSYLGLGVSPPTPSWGLMLNQSIPHINAQPMATLAPAMAIITTILGLNLISDGLNKALVRK